MLFNKNLEEELSKTYRNVNLIQIPQGGRKYDQSTFKGDGGVFIPVKDPERSAKWYEEIFWDLK